MAEQITRLPPKITIKPALAVNQLQIQYSPDRFFNRRKDDYSVCVLERFSISKEHTLGV
jgi:hypothetical protein